MVIVPVILAGGIGERFWPISRSSSPKQLLRLVSSRTMLEDTIERVAPLCQKGVKPLIITGIKIAGQMKKLLPKTLAYDCIAEPEGKNTAPAILLAAAWIEKKYGPAVTVILSADHSIRPKNAFRSAVKTAVDYAISKEALVIFGIKPSRPETGYGYLNIGSRVNKNRNTSIFEVKKFIEKPSAARAKSFCAKSSYLWNSGMFVWKTSVIINEFSRSLPDLYALLPALKMARFSKKALIRYYRLSDKISIDYGIMEKAKKVYAVSGTFEWDDIGSWEALPRIHKNDKNGTTAIGRNILNFSSRNSIVFNNKDAVVSTIGLNNIAVIVTDDAVLVADRSTLPDLKTYLSEIKNSKNLPGTLF
jgi:mannose-1-phosphate guanylyltransferase